MDVESSPCATIATSWHMRLQYVLDKIVSKLAAKRWPNATSLCTSCRAGRAHAQDGTRISNREAQGAVQPAVMAHTARQNYVL